MVKQGGKLSQETRRWDDVAGITEIMRTKEMAHDYRYFPEPDLMPFVPGEAWLAEVRQRVVELPLARKQRFMAAYQLPAPMRKLSSMIVRWPITSKPPRPVPVPRIPKRWRIGSSIISARN